VLVTGAAGGIGHACALHLDQLGFRVFAGVRRVADADKLAALASARLTPILLDVTDPLAIRAAVGQIEAEVGPAGLSGLINNAGITIPGPLEFLPLDELRAQFEVNVIGQLAVTQATLPLLRAGHGRVVNMGSLSGRVSLPFYGAYAASKFALEALTDAMRVELRPWRIPVSIVEPGIVATPIWERALAAGDAWMQHAAPEVGALYGPAMVGVRANARRLAKAAFPPAQVAAAVGHALTAPRPRSRYRVGYNLPTRLLLVLDRLPPPLRDAIIARTLPKYP
jgi:NAD(P)-dependent dehydrogenase (short-subunit alcohol dehydrogenase family)